MEDRRSSLAPAVVLIVTLLSGGWLLQRGAEQEQNVYVQSRLLQEIVDHIADRYVDPVERRQLYEQAIEGVLGGLGDPNTSLMGVDDYESFRIQTEGDYGGVGLEIVERDDFITVVSPIPGGPGSRAGIRAGDRIVEVDGTSIEGWSSQRAVGILRGRPATEVDVTVLRPGIDETIEFTVTREQIQLRSVAFATMLDDGIGYLPLSLFQERSGQEAREALDSLQAEGMRSLVLDLRGNPGGILEQGIEVADLLLPRNVPVVETRGQARNQSGTIRTSRESGFSELPIVVLVDHGSASASEIVAGALQDHDRALVLGNISYGKGSVQSLFRLTGGNVLKLTTARWYTPQGRSIERVAENGERPDPLADAAEAEGRSRAYSISVDGQVVPLPDTAGRPVVESVSGRMLYGGGGITPDVLVLPDTLTANEQGAVGRIARRGGALNAALFDFAVRYLQENPGLEPPFQVTDGVLDRFYDVLQEREIEIDRDTFDRAGRYLARQIEAEVALQAWGEEEAFHQKIVSDRPLQRAVELLRSAPDREGLFTLAGQSIPLGPEESGQESSESGSR